MTLTLVERLMLANQYRILAKLSPDEAVYFAELREIVERGYEGCYFRLEQSIDPEVVSNEQCNEVLDILTMFTSLKEGYDALPDKTGIEARDVRFDGFDGNNEGGLLSFARFFCKSDGGKFITLIKIKGDVPNSHGTTIEMYRRMLRVFRCVPDQEKRPEALSKESIQRIVAARAARALDAQETSDQLY